MKSVIAQECRAGDDTIPLLNESTGLLIPRIQRVLAMDLPFCRTWGAAYSSHLPVLMTTMLKTQGPVLELGTGVFSTPVLHWMCAPRRPIVSCESDRLWFDRVAAAYREYWHDVQLIEDWDAIHIEWPWSVAFLDHEPHRRATDLARLKGNASCIVVHDTEVEDHHLEPVLSGFRYRYDWRRMAPWTTVVSDTIDVAQWFKE